MIYGTPEFETLLFDMIQTDKRHPLYGKWVECYNSMKPHIYGDKPLGILERTRPREPQEVKQYRIDNYEPTTKSTASKALSIVGKIFNPWLSEIKWKDQTTNGKKLQDYTLEYYPGMNSVVKYVAEAGVKRMIADANGVMAIRPSSPPSSDLEYAMPIVIMYGSPSIWWFDNDCYVIHTKEEETRNGIVHYFSYYDKNFVADFTAKIINAKTVSYQKTDFVYKTNFNEIPVWPLQGESETNDEGLSYYVSFFEPAKSFWNLVITHDSDVFGNYIQLLFPLKVEVAEECDFVFEDQRCAMGKIQYPDGKLKECPSCRGTGFRRSSGPYGSYQVSSDKLKGNTTGNMQPVSFVSVPTEPAKMLEERVDRLHQKGLAALNMDIVDNIGENQSGIAKVIDRGELYDFLYKIASVVYDTHLTNIFYFFNKYMFGIQDQNPNRKVDDNLPEINKPVKFDLSSTGEMTVDYKTAKDAGVNPEYLRQKQIAIVAKEFANNPDLRRKLILQLELDPLPGLSVDDADALIANGTISKRDVVLHFQMGKFVNRAIAEDNAFYNMPEQGKIALLISYADQFLSENKMTLDMSMVAPDQQPMKKPASKFSVGDSVRVIAGMEHMAAHKGLTMTIAEADGNTYALKLPDGSIHKWYTGDELVKA